ncbi:MAG: hypothetical protein LUE86_01315, partial [Clostridiales bacterium]|nr:hypothetical protein [Clostridiales bacterium]
MIPVFTTPVLAAFSLKKMLVNALTSLLGGSSQLSANIAMQTALNIMTFQQTDADIVSQALSVTAPIGFLLMVANFLAGCGKSSMRDHEDGLQAFVRAGIWLLIADFMLIHLADIAGIILGLSGSYGKIMKDKLTMNSSDFSNALSDANNFSILALVIALVMSVFGWGAQIIASLITTVICLSAKIEIMLRLSFCPI